MGTRCQPLNTIRLFRFLATAFKRVQGAKDSINKRVAIYGYRQHGDTVKIGKIEDVQAWSCGGLIDGGCVMIKGPRSSS